MSDTSTSADDFTDTSPDETAGDTPADVDWKAEAEKYKALHRKQEERAKSNAQAAKDLEKLRQDSMSDAEKARNEGKAEGLRESGIRLVDAEVRAAVKGRDVEAKTLLEGLDRSRFLDDDGQPDVDKIIKWVDKIAPAKDDRVAPGRGGPRSTGDRPNDMNALIRRTATRG